jgi:hypothetical protein
MQKVCAVLWCIDGSAADADAALAPARKVGKPALDGVMELPLPAWNSAFDGLFPPGDQWYWRGDYVEEIPDAAIETHVNFGKILPTWKSLMHLYPSDGAAARGARRDAVGLPRRQVTAVIAGVDPDPANADALRSDDRVLRRASHTDGRLVRELHDGGGSGARSATYGSNYARLASIKAQYDPENVFHVNQNIKPA